MTSDIISDAAASAVAFSEGDPQFRVDLHGFGPVVAAENAFKRLGVYKDNKKAWQSVTQQLVMEGQLSKRDVEDIRRLVAVLAEQAEVTQASFWDAFTEKVAPSLEAEGQLDELLEMCRLFTHIRCYSEAIFAAATRRLMQEWAVYVLTPARFTQLLEIMSKAGSSHERISRMATLIFNQALERLGDEGAFFEGDENEPNEFTNKELISVIQSMARFQVNSRAAAPVLQKLGRDKLHPAVVSLEASQIADICHTYSTLGFRHDTLFKQAIEAIIREFEDTQRARALGQVSSAPGKRTVVYDDTGSEVTLKYEVSDIALIAYAALNLKMHRGNTTWCKWADNYEELVDLLERRMDVEVDSMGARALAAGAYVLGRAKAGNEALNKAMYERMVELLAADHDLSSAHEPPQSELALFLDGLVQMGPTRKKDLDGQWLMHWICHNYMTFNLGDLVRVNRHLVSLGISDDDYLKIFVDPFYAERIDELSKSDIMELTHTYNHARLGEEGLGRHFFWAMGLRFQKLHAMDRGQKMRPDYRRIG